MVDYSKWDNIDISDSDEEVPSNKPKVTTLAGTNKITIGPNGWHAGGASSTQTNAQPNRKTQLKPASTTTPSTIPNPALKKNKDAFNYSKWDALAAAQSDSDEEPVVEQPRPSPPPPTSRSTPITTKPSSNSSSSSPTQDTKQITSSKPISEQKDSDLVESLTVGGGVTPRYLWAQDKTTVLMYVFVPKGTLGRDVEVILKPQHLSVKLKGKIHLEGKISYEVLAEEDDLDWEIKPHLEQAIILITLTKKDIGGGVIIWWRCVLQGDPEIDTTQIKGRANNSYREVWEKAHEMFREKVANYEQVEIDCGPE